MSLLPKNDLTLLVKHSHWSSLRCKYKNTHTHTHKPELLIGVCLFLFLFFLTVLVTRVLRCSPQHFMTKLFSYEPLPELIWPDPTWSDLSWHVSGGILPTTVWKHEWSCVRKGGLSCWARTLFSTMVHSTSSSWITTSFFRIFIAYSSSVAFISASMTFRGTDKGEKIISIDTNCSCSFIFKLSDTNVAFSPCRSCLSPGQRGRRSRRVWPDPGCWKAAGRSGCCPSRRSPSYLGLAWLSALGAQRVVCKRYLF